MRHWIRFADVYTPLRRSPRSHISHSTLARNHEHSQEPAENTVCGLLNFLSISFLSISRVRASLPFHLFPTQLPFNRCPAAVVVVSLPFLILEQKRTTRKQKEKKKTKRTNYWKWKKRSGSSGGSKKNPSFLEAKTFFCWTFFYHRSFSHVSSFPFSIFTFRFFFFSFASYLHMTHTDCMQSPSSAREENISYSLYVDSETKKAAAAVAQSEESHLVRTTQRTKLNKNRNIWSHDAAHTDPNLLWRTNCSREAKKKQWKFCRNGSVASESKWH